MAFQRAMAVNRGGVAPVTQMRARPAPSSNLTGPLGIVPFNPLRIKPRTASRALATPYKARVSASKAVPQRKSCQQGGSDARPGELQKAVWWRGLVGGMVLVPAVLSGLYAPKVAHAHVKNGPDVIRVRESGQRTSHLAKGLKVEQYVLAEAANAGKAQALLQSTEAKFAATLGALAIVAFLVVKFMQAGEKAPTGEKAPSKAEDAGDPGEEEMFKSIFGPVEGAKMYQAKRANAGKAPAAATAVPAAAAAVAAAPRAVAPPQAPKAAPTPAKPVALESVDESVFDIIDDPIERERLRSKARAAGTVAKGSAAPAPAPAGTADEYVFDVIDDPVERERLKSKARAAGKLGAPAKSQPAVAKAATAPAKAASSTDAVDLSFIDDPLERQRLAMQISASGRKVTGANGVADSKPSSTPVAAPSTDAVDLSFIDDPLERQRLAMQITASGRSVIGTIAPTPTAAAPAVPKSASGLMGDVFDVIDDPVERARLRSKAAAKAEAVKLSSSAAELSGRLAPEVAEIIRTPQAVPATTQELQDAVIVSSGAVVEEIDLSFIPDIVERERLAKKIAARRAAASPAAAAPKTDPKVAAAADLAASAKELSGRLAPDVAAVTAQAPVADSTAELRTEVVAAVSAVDPSVFETISDPVERAKAVASAKAAGRYAAPDRPSGASRSMPPGSTLARANPPPPAAAARLTSNGPPPPPVPKSKKKWWKKLKGWRVAVTRKEAVENAMKAAAEPQNSPQLQFDQGSAGLSLRGAAPPKARKSFPQVFSRKSPDAPLAPAAKAPAPTPPPPVTPSTNASATSQGAPKPVAADPAASAPAPGPALTPAAGPAATAQKKKFDAASFFLQQSIDTARKSRPEPVFVPADVSRPLPETPSPPPPMPAAATAAAQPKLSSDTGPIVPAAKPAPPAPEPEAPVVINVQRGGEPKLSSGPGPITPAGGQPVPAKPFTPAEIAYSIGPGPLTPVNGSARAGMAMPVTKSKFVTDNGPIMPVGAVAVAAPAPAPVRTLVDGPGPIKPVGPPQPAGVPAAYLNTKPSLSSANGPIIPANPAPERAPFVASVVSKFVTANGPIVPVLAPGLKRVPTPIPQIAPSMVSGNGPVRPATGVPPVWPRPPVLQRMTSDGGPVVPAGREQRVLPAQVRVMDASRASLSAGPGPVVPSVVRKMLGALDLSPKFSKWAPSLEAGKASWGERPLMPIKPAGVSRGTGFGKASWKAERVEPGAPQPGSRMPGFPADGSSKATIFVGPGPLVPAEIRAKNAAAKDDGDKAKKDDGNDNDDGPAPPGQSAQSGPGAPAKVPVSAAANAASATSGAAIAFRPVGGLESGWLTNLIMGNRKYGVQSPVAATAAAPGDTQDGSSPYLAKSEGAIVKSGSNLRTGIKKIFGNSGSLSQALSIPGKKGSLPSASLRVNAEASAPRGPPANGNTPSYNMPSSPAPDPIAQAFSVSRPSPTRARSPAPAPAAVGSVSVPAVIKRDFSRVDPATYMTGDVYAARESILAAQSAALAAGQATVPPPAPARVAVHPIADFTSDEESDVEEDAVLSPRRTTGASPVLAALGLFAAATEAVSPLWKSQEQIAADKQRAKATAPLPRSSRGRRPAKYDLFAELLTSVANDQKLKGGEEWSAVRWLTDFVPNKGVQKFDVLRIFIRGLVEAPSASAAPSKYDMVWDLLKESRETGVGADKRYDPVYALLHNAALAADWGLPQNDPVRDLLHIGSSDWEPSKYDPVAAFFNGGAGWHGNVRPKWDPLQAVLHAKAPQGQGWLDPVGDMLKRANAEQSPRARSVAKPLQARPASAPEDGPPTGSSPPEDEEKPIVVTGVPRFNPLPAPKTLVGSTVMAASVTPALPSANSVAALPPAQPAAALPAAAATPAPVLAAAPTPVAALAPAVSPSTPVLVSGEAKGALPAPLAAKSAAYDPVPDLIRLQGARGGAGRTPYDPVVVIVRRGGGLDFMDAATSFREMLNDEQLSQKYGGMYAMLMDSQNPRVAGPTSVLAHIPAAAQDKGMIENALQSVEGLLADITDKYPKLYRMLSGRARETVVDAMCALAALVQPQPVVQAKAV